MKRSSIVVGVLFGILLGTLRAETVSIVQITDMQGLVGYQVMNREEQTALQKEIKDETAALTAIMAECKKEWESNKENKLPFQGGRIKPRAAKKMGADFSDRAKADLKRAQYEERTNERQLEELNKEAAKLKMIKNEQAKAEYQAKEEARLKAFNDSFALVSKKLGEKLGRPVPGFGLPFAEGKKEEKKAAH